MSHEIEVNDDDDPTKFKPVILKNVWTQKHI